ELVDALKIATGRLRPERYGAVDPGTHLHRAATAEVPAEAGRNLDHNLELAPCEPVLDLAVIRERRLFGEIDRAAELLQIGTALRRIVAIEGGEGKVVDIGVDADP